MALPSGAETKLVPFSGWGGSASRFVGEDAGMRVELAV